MKVVCLNNKLFSPKMGFYYFLPLTIGKIYTATLVEPTLYRLVGDNNLQEFYDISNFLTLEEYRNRKIKNILN